VRDCVDRSISQLNLDEIIARQVRIALSGAPNYSSDAAFNKAIASAVAEEAKRLVEARFAISVTLR
jgi:hypothetical protein